MWQKLSKVNLLVLFFQLKYLLITFILISYLFATLSPTCSSDIGTDFSFSREILAAAGNSYVFGKVPLTFCMERTFVKIAALAVTRTTSNLISVWVIALTRAAFVVPFGFPCVIVVPLRAASTTTSTASSWCRDLFKRSLHSIEPSS